MDEKVRERVKRLAPELGQWRAGVSRERRDVACVAAEATECREAGGHLGIAGFPLRRHGYGAHGGDDTIEEWIADFRAVLGVGRNARRLGRRAVLVRE